jgi:hypothetical protein
MKFKHLPNLLAIAIIMLIVQQSSAQQQDGNIQHDPSVIVSYPTQNIYDDGRIGHKPSESNFSYPKLINLPGCDTLFGNMAPTNGYNGIMFNLKALQMTRVDFFNCFLSGPGSGWMRLYARFGTWVGHETDLAGWSLVDSVFMNVTASGIHRIPIYVGQVLHINETGSYYLTFSPGSTAGVQYEDGVGTIQDTLYNSNVTLRIHEGVGHGNLFDACCEPRVFAGTVEHCPSTVNDCQSFTTTFAGGNGNAGSMFNVSTNHDITFKGFSGAIVDSGYFKLYYRYGSYAGHQDSASHWTFVDSNFVVSAGIGVPTTLFSNLNIPLNEGESMAFYITANNSGGSVDYTNGTAEGSVFGYDGVLRLYEGLGKAYPFGSNNTPRVFNGIIDYCIVPGFIGIEENDDITNQIKVYPVPTTGELYMDFSLSGDREIFITDMTGRICTKLNNQTSDLVKMDVSGYSNGIYLYTVINNGQREISGKFIKQ